MEAKRKQKDSELSNITKNFNSLHEELEHKNSQLEKVYVKLQETHQNIQSSQEDFDRERNDMYDTITELTSQLALKNMII